MTSTATYPADLQKPEFRMGRLWHPDRYQHELDYVLGKAGITTPVKMDSRIDDIPTAFVRLSWKKFAWKGFSLSLLANPKLMEELSPVERLALIAHEVGHIKHGHFVGRMAFKLFRLVAEISGFTLALNYVVQHGFLWLFVAVPLLMCMIIVLAGLFNAYSRRHEYQADAAVVRMFGPQYALPLMATLYKGENFAERFFSRRGQRLIHPRGWLKWFVSHPSNLERCEALGIKAYDVHTYLRQQRET